MNIWKWSVSREPITAQEARLRTFGYLVSLGCFGLGFLWALFDPEQLTWHDKISRTLVVRKPGNADPTHIVS